MAHLSRQLHESLKLALLPHLTGSVRCVARVHRDLRLEKVQLKNARAWSSRQSPSAGQKAPRLAEVTRTGTPSAAPVEDASLASWWRRRMDRSASHGPRPDSELVTRLSVELEMFATAAMPRDEQVQQKDEFLRRLQAHLADVVDGAKVTAFGSAVNGFWTPLSDVDVCVFVPGARTRNSQIQVLRKIAGELAKVSSHHIEPRFGAQVPILHWAPQRPGMVSCDISVNNELAVANSYLILEYTALDARLRPLGLCLKAWAQARGINDRSRGTVSSFALVLMLIHFLQRRDPPALPSLQDIAFSRSQPASWVCGFDCRYCTDRSEVAREMEYLRAGKPQNEESLGFLLLEFFRHFTHEYRHGVIRIRDTRALLPPSDESQSYLVVDNPFEVGKDVANVDSSQHDIIKKELRRAWSLLSQGRGFRDLLHNPTLEEEHARRRPLAWATDERPTWTRRGGGSSAL